MRRFLAAAVLAAAALACHSGPSATDGGEAAERIPVTIDSESGAVVFSSEIADTPEERAQGLMHRTSMGEREGMIFLFPRASQQSFWMRNTLIPLDMVFIKPDHTILGVVENATPRTDTPRNVPGESQFVLELNGGTARKLGIKPGQQVSFYAPVPSR